MKPYLRLFAIGAVAGTLLDGMQTWGGVAFYTNPLFLKTAGWVPFLFGGATVLVAYTHWKIHPLNFTNAGPFWGSLFLLVLICLGTAFWNGSGAQKTALVFNFYLVSWGLFDRTPMSLFLAVGTAVAGTMTEIILGDLDLYKYTHPDFLDVPYWLPGIYCHFSQTAGHLGRLLLTSKDN